MLSVKQLVTDPALWDLMRPHLLDSGSLDLALASQVKNLLPQDNFSISQYLLGLGYFRRRIEAALPVGGTLLDVGCGAGVWSIAASFLHKLVIGIDIDGPRLRCAQTIGAGQKGSGDLHFIRCPAPSTPLRNSSVDVLLCHNMLQFVTTPHLRALQELRRVARPGARLYVWVTDRGYLFFLRDQALRSRDPRKIVSWLRIVLDAWLFRLGLRSQPWAWMPQSHVYKVTREASWRVIDARVTLSPKGAGVRSIFPATYHDLPLGADYLLEAI